MPLQGSLGHLGLADLLQTGLTGHDAGLLTLRNGASRALLYVGDEGLTLLEPDVLDAEDVINAFVERGLLSPDAVDRARRHAPGGLSLLDALTSEGTLPENALNDLLASWAEDTILDLLTWDRGDFRFTEGPLDRRTSGLMGRTSVDLGGVLLRAAQRMDERAEIADAIGFHACMFVSVPGSQPPPVEEPGDPAPQVHLHLNGRSTLDEVALILGIGRFAALKAAHRLVMAGAARVASQEELEDAVRTRMDRRAYRSVRPIVLQWAEAAPSNPMPLRQLATLGRLCHRVDEEIDALRSIAHLLIGTGRSDEAVHVLQEAVDRHPNHGPLLTALRDASESAGDVHAYGVSTLRIAEAALEDGDPDRAAGLLDPLVRARPDAWSLRRLHGKALLRAGRHDALIEEAEDVLRHLGRRLRRREEREVAETYARAVETADPTRDDLLKRYHTLLARKEGGAKRVALVAALVVVFGAAGVVLWPPSASDLLQRAESAMSAGRRDDAQELLAELIERYPDAPESESAFQLQASMLRPIADNASRQRSRPSKDLQKALHDQVAQVRGALGRLPSAESSLVLQDFMATLERKEVEPLRQDALKSLRIYTARALSDLQREVRRRADVLDRAPQTVLRLGNDRDRLSGYLGEANDAANPTFLGRVKDTLPILDRLRSMDAKTDLVNLWLQLKSSVASLEKAREDNKRSLVDVRRQSVRLDVAALESEVRQRTPRLIVNGQLEEADKLFTELERRLQEARDDPDLIPVANEFKRRQVQEWVASKREMISSVHDGVEAAKAVEAAGDLDGAARTYAKLIQRYEFIRFENVFTLPIQVRSQPPGALVKLNGQTRGRTPLVVRYAWGSESSLTVTSPGYAPFTHLIDTMRETPETDVLARLTPTPVWSVPGGENIVAEPIDVGSHVLTVERSGRVTLYDGRDGGIRWSREYRSIEGIRARPALGSGLIHIGQVDGTILMLGIDDGASKKEIKVGRPVGDLASVGEFVGVAATRGELHVLRSLKETHRAPLGAMPTAGVLGAHKRFWVGLGDGRVAIVDPSSGRVQHVTLRGTRSAVRSLSKAPDGVVVTASSGSLTYIRHDGSISWHKESVGDIVGRAGVTAGVVGVGERRGRMVLFRTKDGAPAGAHEMGAVSPHGIYTVRDVLLAHLKDGRLLALDPHTGSVRVDADLQGHDIFPLGTIGKKRDLIVVSRNGRELAVIPVPQQPGE